MATLRDGLKENRESFEDEKIKRAEDKTSDTANDSEKKDTDHGLETALHEEEHYNKSDWAKEKKDYEGDL